MNFLFAEILQGLTLVKILTAVSVVVGLSLLAEHVSPKFAGIISGYPLGAAISLFFIGLEIGPDFAAHSAVYTIVGLGGTQAFIYGYYQVSRLLDGRSKNLNVFCSSCGSAAVFLIAAGLLNLIRVNLPEALVLASALIIVFHRLFKKVRNVLIEGKARPDWKLLLARAFFAAFLITAVTTAAKVLGPRWAGLFSAFPMTLFPFLLIIHYTYRTQHVHAVIKNVPQGLFSLLTYLAVVSLVYPRWGIWLGTLIAYAGATLYLLIVYAVRSPLFRINRPTK